MQTCLLWNRWKRRRIVKLHENTGSSLHNIKCWPLSSPILFKWSMIIEFLFHWFKFRATFSNRNLSEGYPRTFGQGVLETWNMSSLNLASCCVIRIFIDNLYQRGQRSKNEKFENSRNPIELALRFNTACIFKIQVNSECIWLRRNYQVVPAGLVLFLASKLRSILLAKVFRFGVNVKILKL